MKKHYQLTLMLAFSIGLLSCTEQFTELNTKPNQDDNLVKANFNAVALSQIQDSYIVVYKENTSDKEIDDEVDELDKKEKVRAENVYKGAFKGYSVHLSPSALAKLKSNPKIAFIEKDELIGVNAVIFQNATWGLDRIDQTSLPLSTSFIYTSNGSGVDAYIIDTGILLGHVDFGGRAVGGYSVVGATTNWTDQNGHGTHVAGTVGGNSYGVAKNVKLIAVRVFDGTGSGSISGVIAGINWMITNHTTNPAVANMSLGGSASSALDLAVTNAVKDGIVMCVAAGNNAADASRYSPARVSTAITVGATGSYPTLGLNHDVFASYSNYGTVVDVLAPGSSILSDYITNTTSTAILSGTSMATPHVAGVSALYLSTNKNASPAQVETFIKNASTKNKITGLKGSTVNSLLFTNN
jgi:subtilisin family serine protease